MSLISLLQESIERWNQWRSEHPNKPCNLEGEDLSEGYFFEGDFSGVNLRGANLRRACLIGADLRWADLTGADLTGAYLGEANLYGASLDKADFTGASLERVDLRRVRGLSPQLAYNYRAQQA
ncbi:MAG: pentapeptide repeat-containing protein [Cyanobacteria bacterium P01_F01_bin.53]